MGWFGHNPWDGDSPMDMLGTLDEQRSACLSRLVGVPISQWRLRKSTVTLKKVADDWARQWSFVGGSRMKKGRLVLDDRFDQWSVVGVICKVLNQDVALDRQVVVWAFDVAEDIWTDAAWCNTWKHPIAFRAAVRHVADQLATALDKTGKSTRVWATIEPALEPKRRRPAIKRGRPTARRAPSRP